MKANFNDIGSATSNTYSTNGLSNGNIIRLVHHLPLVQPQIIYTKRQRLQYPPTIANAGSDQNHLRH
jgi:hypothetical protein